MRIFLHCLPGLLAATAAAAADAPISYDDFLQQLHRNADRPAVLDSLWQTLQDRGRIPFVQGEKVAFLYRGPARTVTFTGDFNRWQPSPPRSRRLGGSDLWLQEETFPADARLDYKIVVDGQRWLLDPANPHRQRGGFGDNSFLAMPCYRPSPFLERDPDTPRGHLESGRLPSAALGHDIEYKVYLPADYDRLDSLPVIYVTDGHEYADPRMGSMVIVLDNLIGRGLLRPVMAVFIDPRAGGRNLRAEQYILSETFLVCVSGELVPRIDGRYRTSDRREDRAILGTSLGGLNAAWFALRAPDVFGRAALQSPAFHAGDGAILDHYRTGAPADVDFFISWGTFHDFGPTTREFLDILDGAGIDYRTMTTHEGHSWGQWRALLDDVLLGFWPAAGDPTRGK